METVREDNRQLEQKFDMLKAQHNNLYNTARWCIDDILGKTSFLLQHPNNVARARAARQEQPRKISIKNLLEPDGGLILKGDNRAFPADTAQYPKNGAIQKRPFEASGDGKLPPSGGKNGDNKKAKLDAGGRPGPAVVEGEEEKRKGNKTV